MRRGYVIVLHVVAAYMLAGWLAEVQWSRALEGRISELRSRIDSNAPRGAVLRGLELWDW